MEKKQDSTRERIKAAAWEVFVEKGRDGARMQEIADRAGANKAMIFYYFTSKDNLFEELIRDIFNEIIGSVRSAFLQSYDDPADLIRAMVEAYIDFLNEHPHLPRVMTREIQSGNPATQQLIRDLFHQESFDVPMEISMIFKKLIKTGKLRQVDPQQTIISFLGLVLFYFIAKPLLAHLWDMNKDNEEEFIRRRKEAIIDLMLNGLLPR